ncbi:hypothetical protein, partial [Neisseria gonorrhoeae]|uniref:hypothetical protein n=1 Tax=Neisseria gonorrhoeae TaxID=485 RepID=UPI00384B71AA
FAAQPTKKVGVLPCAVAGVDEGGIVIGLPMLEWTQAGVMAKQEEKRTQAREQAQVRQEQTEGQLLNILGQKIIGDIWCKPVEYLAKKGI